MKISVKQLSSELAKIREEDELSKIGITPGMYAFLNAGYTASSTHQIDWDSFSLEDAERAFEHVRDYQPSEYVDDDVDCSFNMNNVLHDYMECIGLVRSIRLLKYVAMPDLIHFF
ncbi:hypothetical protein ACE41H_15285 [Paenibacillus enshidis]|uniref:Uncharacterized protein n=1 Tax=Paenibacillus enshidis TaxID=1458439 RepID=A0ABV5AV99_9BACL